MEGRPYSWLFFSKKKSKSIKRLRIFPSKKAEDKLEGITGLEEKLFHLCFAKYSQNLDKILTPP